MSNPLKAFSRNPIFDVLLPPCGETISLPPGNSCGPTKHGICFKFSSTLHRGFKDLYQWMIFKLISRFISSGSVLDVSIAMLSFLLFLIGNWESLALHMQKLLQQKYLLLVPWKLFKFNHVNRSGAFRPTSLTPRF